jgi:hypothetical protein
MTVILAYTILKTFHLPRGLIFLFLLGIIYLTPLIPILFGGMEHVLQTLLTIFFAYRASIVLSEERVHSPSLHLLLCSLFVTSVRYEGLFIVFVVCVLLILRQRVFYALALGLCAISPLVIYAIISLSKGWGILPNSILLKGNMPDVASLKSLIGYFAHGMRTMTKASHMFSILVIALAMYIINFRKKMSWDIGQNMLILFILTTVLHIQFARTDWFFRYEAYLVALWTVAMGISLSGSLPEKIVFRFQKEYLPLYVMIILLITILSASLFNRGIDAIFETPQAMTNIYEQQYQMGLFLKRYYQGQGVAANDIGAINYLAEIRNLDLFGLGSLEVTKMKRNKRYTTAAIQELARRKDIVLALLYDTWFKNQESVPVAWVKVGEWTITNNVVCGSDTVSFYATTPREIENLRHNLLDFSTRLPSSVRQSGLYMKTSDLF